MLGKVLQDLSIPKVKDTMSIFNEIELATCPCCTIFALCKCMYTGCTSLCPVIISIPNENTIMEHKTMSTCISGKEDQKSDLINYYFVTWYLLPLGYRFIYAL